MSAETQERVSIINARAGQVFFEAIDAEIVDSRYFDHGTANAYEAGCRGPMCLYGNRQHNVRLAVARNETRPPTEMYDQAYKDKVLQFIDAHGARTRYELHRHTVKSLSNRNLQAMLNELVFEGTLEEVRSAPGAIGRPTVRYRRVR